MRICQIISHYVPAYSFGGPLQVAHSLGQALLHEGHEVIVCTTNQRDDINDLAVAIDQPIDVNGISVYYEKVSFLRRWGLSFGLWQRAIQEIEQADIILIHAHYQFANWIGASLARHYKKPYIIFAHGSLHKICVGHKNKWLKQIYLRIFEYRNLHKALFIAFNAPEELSLSLFQELGQVVPSGIEPKDFEDRPNIGYFRNQFPQLEYKTLFLFLGRLDIQQKGLDLLIPAFATLTKRSPDVHLVLAGPDEEDGVQQLKLLIQQHNLDEHVTFTGLISGREKLAALQDADVFVLTSRFEGMSIALLEALYMGLPLIVTNQVGLCKEIEKVGAGLVVSVNLSEIAIGLDKLRDSHLRESMRGRGTELIQQKYTWDIIARNLVEKIRFMLSHS